MLRLAHFSFALFGFCFLLAAAVPVAGAEFPAKRVRIVVPFAPGGGTDIIARMLAKSLSDSYKQPVLVDNRPGSAGTIGSDNVAKSPPDGYTLLMTVQALAANHTLYPTLPFDTIKDFSRIVLVGATPNVLVVHPSLPVKSTQEFIALAKARPNEIAYASTGTGGAAFLATELFKLLTNVKMLHVPYKGAGPALIGLLSGETQAIIVALPPTVPHIRSGRVRALGVTSERRAELAPEIPTLVESGVQGMLFDTWYGLFGPAAMPRDVVSRLNASVNALLSQAEFKAQMARQAVTPIGGTPESFDKFFRGEIDKFGKVIRASGAKPE